MAKMKTAVKRHLTSLKANARNRARTSEMKTYEKKLRVAVTAGDRENVEKLAKVCASKVDKAAKAGTIHPNKAANKKSQFDKLVNSLKEQG